MSESRVGRMSKSRVGRMRDTIKSISRDPATAPVSRVNSRNTAQGAFIQCQSRAATFSKAPLHR